ncbi:glucose-6-phosphate isomerase [Tepidicaulis sp. LMO-SS28]|uniref:glucose-6-phosphate isomerase n=1 Tax=Tepidicaulis sp. LMO-SS28 TaxID=3447455 RepID=UPI003EE3DCA4
MPYRQSLERCLDAAWLPQIVLDDHHAKAVKAAARLSAGIKAGDFPMLGLARERGDLAAMEPVAEHLLKDTSDLIIIGTGGSSLGAQALAQLTGWGTPGHDGRGLKGEDGPRFHFPDNLDAGTFEQLLTKLDLRSTRFLVISKSGGTAETLMQMLAAMSAIEKAGGGKYMKYHFAVLTEPPRPGTENPLRAIAEAREFPILDHHPDVGGRFSVLSTVGLLPAYLMGLDIGAVRAGAAAVIEDLELNKKAAPVMGAALISAQAAFQKTDVHVLWPYSDRLARFGLWFRQLWGESLGKERRGTLPAFSLGPVDQHSQLQLYLEGPRDKAFTIITTEAKSQGPEVLPELAREAGLDLFAGRRIGDLVDAEQRATIETLARNGCPVREIAISKLDETSLGALFAHFMIETILTGFIWDVDPFSQPAVEEGKVLAREYLARMGA